jgi:hypothetical protein
MNALQAREKSDLYNKEENKNNIKEIMNAVEKASKRGEYSITVGHNLNSFILEFLKEEGYNVKYYDSQRDFYYEIKW